MSWRRMRRRCGRLPGDDTAGREPQQVLDGVALSCLPASHPTEYSLTLDLCSIHPSFWLLSLFFSSAKDTMREFKNLTAEAITLEHSRYYSQLRKHMNWHFFHNL
jgi:hypothetical protein